MAVLSFKVEADYEQLIKLRGEITALENQLKNIDWAKVGTQQVQQMQTNLANMKAEYDNIANSAAKAGASIASNFTSRMDEASQKVYDVKEKIIEQKEQVHYVQVELKKLKEAYRKAFKGSPERKALKADIEAATKKLEEERGILFGLTQEQQKATLECKKLSDAYKSLKDASKDASKGTKDVADVTDEVMGMLEDKMKSVSKTLIGGFGIEQFISQMISVRSEFQAADTAIETMLGNKEKADELMAKVRDYAKISPLEFSDITSATKMMLGFNIEAEKVPKFISAIGDVSMGESGKFNSLTLAFSQMSAAGKLMGQDLLQMINAGFNPLSVMAEKTGKSVGELKEQMSKGAISAEMVQQAFIDATSEGGKFFQMSEKGSQTIQGQISMLQDAMAAMFNDLGTRSEGVIVTAIKGATKLVENYETIGKVLASVAAVYGVYKTALFASIALERSMAVAIRTNTALHGMQTIAIKAQTVAQAALNAASAVNPYVALATVITSVAAATYLWSSRTTFATELQEKMNDAMSRAAAAGQEEQYALDSLAGELSTLTKGTDEYNTVKQKIIDQFGKYDDSLAAEIERVGLTEKAYDRLTIAIRKSALARGYEAAVKEKSDAMQNDLKDVLETTRTKLRDKYDGTKGGRKESDRLYALVRNAITGGKVGMKAGKNGMMQLTGLSGEALKAVREAGVYGSVLGYANKSQIAKDELEDTRKLWGVGENDTPVTDKTEAEVTAKSPNKKYWQDKKKDLEAQLEALPKIKANQKKRDKLVAEINKVDSKLSWYSTSKGGKGGGGKTDTVRRQEQLEEMKRKQELETQRAEEDLRYKRQQSAIDIMNEGSDKELAQLKLNFEKEQTAIKRSYDDLIEQKVAKERQLWYADPKNKGKKFVASASSRALTDDEAAARGDELNASSVKYGRSVQLVQSGQMQSMRDYLKQYGTYEEKRLAIAEEYAQKIAEAQNEGMRLTLQSQMEDALSSLDFDKLKDEINWEGVFGNLKNLTVEQLEDLKKQIRSVMNSDNINIEGFKDLAQQIDNINNAIVDTESEEKNFLGWELPTLNEKKRLQYEYNEAKKTEVELAKEEMRLGSQRDLAQTQISSQLKTIGIEYSAKDVTGANTQNILNKVGEKYDPNTAQYQAVKKALEELAKTERKLNNVQLKHAKSEENVTTKQNALSKFLDKFKNKLSEFVDAMEKVNMNLQELPGLVGQLGFDENTSIGKAASGIADMSNNALGAAKDFQSGNYIGAASKAISAFGTFTDMVGLTGDSDKTYAEDMERLTNANSLLKGSIDALTAKMDDSSLIDALDLYNKQTSNAAEMEQNLQEQLARTGAASKKGIGGHSSTNKKIDKGMTDSDWNAISAAVGKKVSKATDLWTLSSKEMAQIQEKAIAQWIKLMELGDDGYKDITEYLKEYITLYQTAEDVEENFKEKNTSITFSSLVSSFQNSIMDMNHSAEDFANDFENMMKNAMMSAMMSDTYSKKLEEWYNSFSDAMKGDGLSKTEQDTLRNQYNAIVEEAKDQRDALYSMMAWDDNYSQSATKGSAWNMSQDSANELNGRFTALYDVNLKEYTLHQENALTILTMKNIMEGMGGNIRDMYIAADEARTILANSYLELQGINENTAETAKQLKLMQADVSKIKQKTERL